MTRLRIKGSENLTVGLHATSEINQSIRYADTKAAALAAVHGLAVTVLAGRREDAPSRPLLDLLFTAGLLGVLVSAALIAAGQAPRLSSGKLVGRPNRVAFPALAGMARAEIVKAPSPATQEDDVWLQAAELAAIAMAKFRWLHRALVSTVLTLTTVLVWLGATTWLS